ncbi:MAG: hypothetical protein ACYSYL_20095 [Planctomycetota bacterium]|jgi:hypothetical protein
MKRNILMFLVFFVAGCISSTHNLVRVKDPSLIPLERNEAESGQAFGRFRFERFRLVADFNHDGISDMFLSYDIAMFGNAGGHFTFYKGNADGTYTEAGEIFLHPLAVNLREDRKGQRFLKQNSVNSRQDISVPTLVVLTRTNKNTEDYSVKTPE